jgi:acyl carrier protein
VSDAPIPGAQHLPAVRQMLADHLGILPHQADPAAHLVDALGCDSLDCVEVVMALEDAYGIAITDDEAEGCATVADILALLAAKAPPKPVQA